MFSAQILSVGWEIVKGRVFLFSLFLLPGFGLSVGISLALLSGFEIIPASTTNLQLITELGVNGVVELIPRSWTWVDWRGT